MSCDEKVFLFRNDFIPLKAFFVELCAQILNKTHRHLCHIFFGILFMLAVLGLLSGVENPKQPVVVIVLSLVGFSFPTITSHLNAEKMLKQYAVLSSGDTVGIRVVFNEFEFSSNVYGRESTFSYSQISRVISGKLGLYFHIEKSLYVMLKKDSFTVGDYDSFVVFLREKLKDNPKALKGLR